MLRRGEPAGVAAAAGRPAGHYAASPLYAAVRNPHRRRFTRHKTINHSDSKNVTKLNFFVTLFSKQKLLLCKRISLN